MIEVHLIGYTADLRHVVLDVDPGEERGRYRLVVDGDLFATLDDMRVQRWEQGLDVGPWEPAEATYLDEDVEWVLESEEESEDELSEVEDTEDVASAEEEAALADDDLTEQLVEDLGPLHGQEDRDGGNLHAVALADAVFDDWEDADDWAPEPEPEPVAQEPEPLPESVADALVESDVVVDLGEDVEAWGDEHAWEPVVEAEPVEPSPDPIPAVRLVPPEEVAGIDWDRARARSSAPIDEDVAPDQIDELADVAFADLVDAEPDPDPVEPEPELELEPAPEQPAVPVIRVREHPAGPADGSVAPYPPIRPPVGAGRDDVPEQDPATDPVEELAARALDSDVPSRASLPSARRRQIDPESLEVPRDAALTPAQIQAELRAGRSLRLVAQKARTSEAWVQRWLEPIEAERQRLIDQAREMPVVLAEGRSAAPLGRSVAIRLRQRGVDPADATWDAARRPDGTWRITCKFAEKGRTRSASWLLPRGGDALKSASELAREVGWVDRKLARSRAR